MSSSATSNTILDAAERMTQSIGYNGLSFRDLAAAVGIKSASVHYHFPSKADLGAAVARRYTDRRVDYLKDLERGGGDGAALLAAYIATIRATLEQDGRMCLCGMLAAETDGIPPEVRAEVQRFVDLNVAWLSRVLEKAWGDAAREQARAVFAALEGAMLVARGTGDIASFDVMMERFQCSGLLRC